MAPRVPFAASLNASVKEADPLDLWSSTFDDFVTPPPIMRARPGAAAPRRADLQTVCPVASRAIYSKMSACVPVRTRYKSLPSIL
jgi:hypothetical protein